VGIDGVALNAGPSYAGARAAALTALADDYDRRASAALAEAGIAAG